MTATAGERLIYDGDCGFCTRSAKWASQQGRAFPIQPWQTVDDLAALGLTVEDVTTAAYWIEADGTRRRGHEAVGRALVERGALWKALGKVVLSRPLRPLATLVYARVAANRHRMPGGTAACRIDQRP